MPMLYPGALCRIADTTAVAVTIDDGPSKTSENLLDALEAESIKGTFFLSGRAAISHPETARMILQRDHAIATHGFMHEDMARKKRDEVDEDLGKSLATIESVTGFHAKHYRPPYGRLHPAHRDLPALHGCRLVLWSAMPGDFDPRVDVDELRRRVEHVRGGDIIVLHDHPQSWERTAVCISALGSMLRRNGLRTVTL
ncbi:MAG: polysaccharide deacetylase family protein [Bacteroidetes bacterium]|nr:polysaccharide deacetylase family protein [Bacteroidota bacterium]